MLKCRATLAVMVRHHSRHTAVVDLASHVYIVCFESLARYYISL